MQTVRCQLMDEYKPILSHLNYQSFFKSRLQKNKRNFERAATTHQESLMEQDGVFLEPDTIGLSQNSVHRMSSYYGKGASARQSLRYQEPAHPPYPHLDPENFNAFSHRSSF